MSVPRSDCVYLDKVSWWAQQQTVRQKVANSQWCHAVLILPNVPLLSSRSKKDYRLCRGLLQYSERVKGKFINRVAKMLREFLISGRNEIERIIMY